MTMLKFTLLTSLLLLPAAPQDPEKKPPAPVAPASPAAPVVAAAPKQFDPSELKKLAWLSGTWVKTDGDKITEEHWRPLQGTTMLGSSHTFDEKKTHFFEHLRITAMRGTIAYLAMPGGAPPTAFLLTKLEPGLVEFENAKHDHPQRIRYQKTTDGITATICQLDGSRAQAFVFKKP